MFSICVRACACVRARIVPGITGPLLADGGAAGSADAGFPKVGVKEKACEDGAGDSTAENLQSGYRQGELSTSQDPQTGGSAGPTTEEERVQAGLNPGTQSINYR